MKVDYIIVGLGLAGLAFVEELLAANKTFMVFEDDSQTSSLVAGGVYNPVILKRFTPVWNAKEQLEVALPFYERLEQKFNSKFDKKIETKKVFKSIEDQNNWFEAADKPLLVDYLDPKIEAKKRAGIIADFGFGNVNKTGRIDTKKLVDIYRVYLKLAHKIRFEEFEHQQIKFKENGVEYKDITANKIVFCEGYGMTNNLFFNYLPLNEVKGELITIYAQDLKIDFLLKSTLFIFPLGDNYYKVGATFNWTDKTSNPSEEGRAELIEKLKKVITVPYEIIDQTAGVRPTVRDRRPLVGKHPAYPNLAILNGLGTRGVMIAPTVAKQLFNHLETGKELDSEIAISRFQ
ncbi:FAD-dependent oxidoreductase [Polaribacter reichenbachii]|uniref:FAD-dependent oxidoreductase n=1 Tax=Polaribacter reichenbachii TaxID=996801 RepID=A0A1B8TVJ3_9FLAO|nr:FAD-binding oxidoreductase [Polaribacter reichenbachii]APZ45196.1 FAD-dependent oxidoreductase [Polaribacter reichenbachii]AUC19059.1 FAD-dependent oxidoreductase [Polaribacter reichenbachii]OBY63786.1 FAD-dependent oxidoreductase [Polaribacter reichenbachii]